MRVFGGERLYGLDKDYTDLDGLRGKKITRIKTDYADLDGLHGLVGGVDESFPLEAGLSEVDQQANG